MDSQLVTLSKIFTERLFRIPDYQRGYAWGEKQLKDFWADIQQLESEHNHYTGVLTLENVPRHVYERWTDDLWIITSKNYEPYFVVDGQQRLTTAIILVQVIMNNMVEGSKLNYTDKIDMQRKFVFDSKDGGISRSYIFGYERDNPSYNYLKSGIFGEHTHGRVEETVYTQNLERAKSFFESLIGKLSVEEVEVLYKKVTQSLLFNIFTISNEVDVCVAFETMNNRGKPLSYLELLKNRLIYLSLKFDEPDYERDQLRKAINNCWRAMYHSLGKNKLRPLDDDKFLLAHYVIYFDKTHLEDKASPRDQIYYYRDRSYANTLLDKMFITKNVSKTASENERITLKTIYDYVKSLQELVEIWYDIFNPQDSKFSSDVKVWLDKLNRVGADSFLPLILVVMRNVKNERQVLAFLQALERHIFLSQFFAPYWRSSFDRYVERETVKMAVELINGKTGIEKIVKQISDITSSEPNSDRIKGVIGKFKNAGFYDWSLARYFLYEYNLNLQSRSKTSRDKISWPTFIEDEHDHKSVEHIYPQRATDGYWTSRFNMYSPRQRTLLRNSVGNLLPLSTPKNASLSNRAFPEKANGKDKGIVSYRFGSYAENEVAVASEWGPAQILARGEKLLEFLETRWNVSLGTEKDKIAILGLGFLVEEK